MIDQRNYLAMKARQKDCSEGCVAGAEGRGRHCGGLRVGVGGMMTTMKWE